MADIDQAAQKLAKLFSGQATELSDPKGSTLEFLPELEISRLERTGPPPDCWAVDGGQALVADGRCVQVVATRAARCRWVQGACLLEEEGPTDVHVLVGAGGGEEERSALAASGAPVVPGAAVDLNLLRDWAEWQLVARCVEEATPGAMVLVDGDLQPDWRIRARWLAELLVRACERQVTLVGITKHTSLARGGAPLVSQLEIDAERLLGRRSAWWAPVALQRHDVGPGLLVGVARLDPDARFAFRVDLPAGSSPDAVLGQLSALADDAAFPGYPYPLSVADRLAACPGWLRDDVLGQLNTALQAAGVDAEVAERAFADRHRLMERS